MADFLNDEIAEFDRKTLYGAAVGGFLGGLFIGAGLETHFESFALDTQICLSFFIEYSILFGI